MFITNWRVQLAKKLRISCRSTIKIRYHKLLLVPVSNIKKEDWNRLAYATSPVKTITGFPSTITLADQRPLLSTVQLDLNREK